MAKYQKTDLEMARDELMSHIHRCNVLQATPEQQQEWLEDTIDYMAERFPGLKTEELGELRTIGSRFCAPVIPHGKGNTALSDDAQPVEGEQAAEAEGGVEEQETTAQDELAGAA